MGITVKNVKKINDFMQVLGNCNYAVELGKKLNFVLVGIAGAQTFLGEDINFRRASVSLYKTKSQHLKEKGLLNLQRALHTHHDVRNNRPNPLLEFSLLVSNKTRNSKLNL